MPLHITLDKLVLTSHCVCFHYTVISPVPSEYNIGVISLAWSRCICVDFEQVIISLILFSIFFANGMEICSTSAAHMPLVLSCYVIPVHWLLTLNRSLFWLFVSALFADQTLICFMSVAHVSPVLSPLHLRCVGWLWTSHCFSFIVSATVVNWTLISSVSAALVH